MCSRFRDVFAVLSLMASAVPCSAGRTLRVCADPNNLPFSNRAGEGFENRIAEVVAKELGASVSYTWHAQRRGFVRNTLNAGQCDVVMGVPDGFDAVETTRAYYRSTYVFVTRKGLKVSSLDDDVLRRVRIGVHIVGDDYSNPPPAHALGRRNIIQNVSGYSIYGDYSQPNPPARLIEAVAKREIDVAIVWGPFGGYFARVQKIPLQVMAIAPENDPALPFTYEIAMGVRKNEKAWRDELQRAIDTRRAEIERILIRYGVPLKPLRGVR